tara:strand:+ start:187 stop:414 length:228 start_codon:yes stop_codon:yes gene_type:complete
MPSYTMKDPEGIEHDMICTIADMEQKKEEGWTMVFSPPKNNLIGHTGDVISHTSDGWKEVLQKIKSKSPGSDIEI